LRVLEVLKRGVGRLVIFLAIKVSQSGEPTATSPSLALLYQLS